MGKRGHLSTDGHVCLIQSVHPSPRAQNTFLNKHLVSLASDDIELNQAVSSIIDGYPAS